MKLKILIIIALLSTLSGYEIIIDKTLKQKQSKVSSTYTYLALIRDNSKQTVYDPSSNLVWQDNNEAKTIKKDWAGAKRYCKNLNFAGYSDWYLPTIKELETIADYSRYPDAYKKGFVNFTSSRYWSSSPHASYTSSAWDVYFEYGYSGSYYKVDKSYVRCARARQ